MIIISKISLRWLRQAESDLNAAKNSMNSKNYDWSCFQSQQAAEKCLKAFLYNRGVYINYNPFVKGTSYGSRKKRTFIFKN